MYTVHSTCITGLTPLHSSNSMLRFDNKMDLSEKHSAFSLVYRAPDLKSLLQIFNETGLKRPISPNQDIPPLECP